MAKIEAALKKLSTGKSVQPIQVSGPVIPNTTEVRRMMHTHPSTDMEKGEIQEVLTKIGEYIIGCKLDDAEKLANEYIEMDYRFCLSVILVRFS